jgi:glyoxylase-like metal-dependent hydrolase (beta-lactamase superfamily II)
MAKYTIRPVTLCRTQGEKGMMTYLTYYGEKIWRPYIFWIIEGDTETILVDTAIEASDYQNYHPMFRDLDFEHLLTFEQALFVTAGLHPEDIDLVIQTHLHFDHCFNTSRCKKARVLVQQDELEFAQTPHPLFAPMYSVDLLKGLNFETIQGRREVLSGIEVIPVPGHTPGCQAVSVATEAGCAVITGFCCIKENFFPGEDIRDRVSPFAGYPVIAPGIHYDLISAYESVLKIKDHADIVIPMHEPELMEVRSIP